MSRRKLGQQRAKEEERKNPNYPCVRPLVRPFAPPISSPPSPLGRSEVLFFLFFFLPRSFFYLPWPPGGDFLTSSAPVTHSPLPSSRCNGKNGETLEKKTETVRVSLCYLRFSFTAATAVRLDEREPPMSPSPYKKAIVMLRPYRVERCGADVTVPDLRRNPSFLPLGKGCVEELSLGGWSAELRPKARQYPVAPGAFSSRGKGGGG